jgi:hypothetical protein
MAPGGPQQQKRKPCAELKILKTLDKKKKHIERDDGTGPLRYAGRLSKQTRAGPQDNKLVNQTRALRFV